jgi:hypothetical protein
MLAVEAGLEQLRALLLVQAAQVAVAVAVGLEQQGPLTRAGVAAAHQMLELLTVETAVPALSSCLLPLPFTLASQLDRQP